MYLLVFVSDDMDGEEMGFIFKSMWVLSQGLLGCCAYHFSSGYLQRLQVLNQLHLLKRLPSFC